jgi:hypothetical protein
MDPSEYDGFCYAKYCTLSEVLDYWRNKEDGDTNVSKNGFSAWVTLCAHPTYTDIETGQERPLV